MKLKTFSRAVYSRKDKHRLSQAPGILLDFWVHLPPFSVADTGRKRPPPPQLRVRKVLTEAKLKKKILERP